MSMSLARITSVGLSCICILPILSARLVAQSPQEENKATIGEHRFENEIVEFERRDSTHQPPRDGILFVGSSSIRRWTSLEKDFPGLPVINRGFGGAEFGDVIHYLERIVIPYRPRVIVVYAGSHDVRRAGGGPEKVLQMFQSFCAAVHARLPATKVCYLSMKPSIAKWKTIELDREANRLIEQFATVTTNVEFIDIWTPMVAESSPPPQDYFAPDLNHPSLSAYRLWAKTIRPYIE
jgi:lysophospholipase L1-like esterase